MWPQCFSAEKTSATSGLVEGLRTRRRSALNPKAHTGNTEPHRQDTTNGALISRVVALSCTTVSHFSYNPRRRLRYNFCRLQKK